jgi:hypothetical protein
VRPDLDRVLIGSRRSGSVLSGGEYRRDLRRTPPEEWRRSEGMTTRWSGGAKYSTERIGPLRRTLRSNVGRPWDLVYSELCEGMRQGFPDRARLLALVDRVVERHVILVDGVPCHGQGFAHGTPIRGNHWRNLYVCPVSGLLKMVPERKRRKW